MLGDGCQIGGMFFNLRSERVADSGLGERTGDIGLYGILHCRIQKT